MKQDYYIYLEYLLTRSKIGDKGTLASLKTMTKAANEMISNKQTMIVRQFISFTSI